MTTRTRIKVLAWVCYVFAVLLTALDFYVAAYGHRPDITDYLRWPVSAMLTLGSLCFIHLAWTSKG